ncbi:MAG: hypothetical protein A2Z20_05825 [Bdellovibrionales bacterium RBG_16_40_8]|nr:MAG: hypothetical protein A2Z20_05825 [Bdellovibrionales bacterium RBG_16_40_8]
MKKIISVIAFLSILDNVHAIEIPKNLNYPDLTEVIQILGHSTSSKFLSDPFPLGGYYGFEIGVSIEVINTTNLSHLGAGTNKQSSFQYNRLAIGKGLYNNIDAFIHFVPLSNSNEVSAYGGLLKWNFYQAPFYPFSLSVIGHINTMDIKDSFINETMGWDILGGINLSTFSLYFGGGNQRTRSTFSKSILDSAISLNSTGTIIVRESQIHSFAGLNINFSSFFVATQIDRYEQPVYGAKIGLRY